MTNTEKNVSLKGILKEVKISEGGISMVKRSLFISIKELMQQKDKNIKDSSNLEIAW